MSSNLDIDFLGGCSGFPQRIDGGCVALGVGMIEADLGSDVVNPITPAAASYVAVRRVPVPD